MVSVFREKKFIWTSGAVALSGVVLGCFLFVENNLGESSKGQQEYSDAVDAPSDTYISRIWVQDTTRVHVLAQMFHVDEESVAILGDMGHPFRVYGNSGDRRWETNIELFLDAGLVKRQGSALVVDKEISLGEAGDNISLTWDQMAGAVGDTLRASWVKWCGEEVRGVEFAKMYYDEYYGEFDSREEYVESMEEYVKCESSQW